MHPYRIGGVVLLMLGIAVTFAGFWLATYYSCVSILFSAITQCGYFFRTDGTIALILGLPILVIGIVLMVLTGPSGSDNPRVVYVLQSGPPSESSSSTNFCNRCGTKIAGAGRFCHKCGRSFLAPE